LTTTKEAFLDKTVASAIPEISTASESNARDGCSVPLREIEPVVDTMFASVNSKRNTTLESIEENDSPAGILPRKPVEDAKTMGVEENSIDHESCDRRQESPASSLVGQSSGNDTSTVSNMNSTNKPTNLARGFYMQYLESTSIPVSC
jgi:hypothetical protein